MNRNANLRQGPGTNFDIVGSAKANQTVEIIGSNSEGDWLRISDGSWIAAFLVDDIIELTPTPFPTSAPILNSTFELEQFSTLLLKSVDEVEFLLGQPSAITPFYAGYLTQFSGAGENRDYFWNEYWFTAYYDTSGVLIGLIVLDGLADKDYKINEWAEVLAAFGLPKNVPPNKEALAGVSWNNLDGFMVSMGADGISDTSSVWTIQIFAVE